MNVVGVQGFTSKAYELDLEDEDKYLIHDLVGLQT